MAGLLPMIHRSKDKTDIETFIKEVKTLAQNALREFDKIGDSFSVNDNLAVRSKIIARESLRIKQDLRQKVIEKANEHLSL